MLNQTGGFKVKQFTGVTEMYIRPTPVPTATNLGILTQNWLELG